MPQIGKPQQKNRFANIKMRSSLDNMKAKKQNIGDVLNQASGQKPTQKYVDRKKHNQIGKDGFLKLLTHQLQNQDPLKPMDQKQFAADLAQFAQLEKLTNMNTTMEQMNGNQGAESKFFGASFLGKEVLSSGASVEYDGQGKSQVLPFNLKQSAQNVMVRVFDSKNQLVAQIDKESMGQGSQAVTWDGLQLDGTVAVKDTYRFEVRAWDDDMNQFMGETKATGIVTGVHFEGDETVLTVDGSKKVFLRDVDSFKVPKPKDNSAGLNNQMPAVKKNAQAAYGAQSESL